MLSYKNINTNVTLCQEIIKHFGTRLHVLARLSLLSLTVFFHINLTGNYVHNF